MIITNIRWEVDTAVEKLSTMASFRLRNLDIEATLREKGHISDIAVATTIIETGLSTP